MRITTFFLVILMVFSLTTINYDDVYAAAKKSKSTQAKVSKGKPASKYKTSSKNKRSSRWSIRKASVRSRNVAYRRSIARVSSVNNMLLSTAKTFISQDDLRGEDLELRRAALSAIGDHPATVVIMDPNNGQVYSMVNQSWAIGKPFKPCSTIKLITSIAALNEGVADADYPATIAGLGSINMINALAYSNNQYFQSLGYQLGFDQVINYARQWGLGAKTGVNIDGESPGFLPEYKSPQALPRMCSHGDDIGVTALQLAVLTSAIANGGKIYQPQVLRTETDKQNFQPKLIRNVTLTEDVREKLIEGMIGAVTYGTARRSGAAPLNVAGKTGSCNGEESKLGLFASFSSPNKPNLVVVVVSTGSNERGSVSAGIAGEIYNNIAHRLGIEKNNSIDSLELKPHRPRRVTTNDNNQLEFDGEEEDEEDEE